MNLPDSNPTVHSTLPESFPYGELLLFATFVLPGLFIAIVMLLQMITNWRVERDLKRKR